MGIKGHFASGQGEMTPEFDTREGFATLYDSRQQRDLRHEEDLLFTDRSWQYYDLSKPVSSSVEPTTTELPSFHLSTRRQHVD